MDFDGVVQVLITVGFVAFWLFGVGRKKRPPPPQVSRDLDASAPPGPPRKTDTERMIMQALGLVEGTDPVSPLPLVQAIELPEEFAPYEEEAETRPMPPEAQTLMVGSSPAEQERRHDVFHHRYIDAPEVKTQPPARVKRRLDRSSMRQAIVWREIVGPPKGME